MFRAASAIAIVLALTVLAAGAARADVERPLVRLTTSTGDIVIELDPEHAPATVENFLAYVRSGFYDGTIFHRVIPGFMIQGGGFTTDMEKRETAAPIRNEAPSTAANRRGTVAMARTGQPHSATAQFFVNLVDNGHLDHSGRTLRGWGYAVFGRVVEGMEVVDRIAAVATATRAGHEGVPVTPVVILAAAVEADPKKE